MQLSPKPSNNGCLYCGRTGKLSKEHVIPKGLGGSKTIRAVCESCNSEELSNLCTELCSRSPLDIIRASYMPDHIPTQLWRLEPNYLMVDGVFHSSSNSFVTSPQLIVVNSKVEIRSDLIQTINLGPRAFHELITRRAKIAFQVWSKSKDRKEKARALKFEKIDNPFLPRENVFAPRVSFRGTALDLEEGTTPIIRYRDDTDKRAILNTLDTMYLRPPKGRLVTAPQASQIAFSMAFSPSKISRALIMIGVNILRFLIPDLTRNDLRTAIDLVLGRRGDHPLLKESGFVRPCQLEAIAPKPDAHTFVISNHRRFCFVYGLFFGGACAVVAKFPAHVSPGWIGKRIIAPIGSSDWWIEDMRVHLPTPPVVDGPMNELFPTLPARNHAGGVFLVPKRSK